MFEETRRHQSPTGAMLAYRYAPASGVPRGILLILHGLTEHSGRYRQFAVSMAAMVAPRRRTRHLGNSPEARVLPR
jgi:alpha-beta hydrolase superfamily lysophospholipase